MWRMRRSSVAHIETVQVERLPRAHTARQAGLLCLIPQPEAVTAHGRRGHRGQGQDEEEGPQEFKESVVGRGGAQEAEAGRFANLSPAPAIEQVSQTLSERNRPDRSSVQRPPTRAAARANPRGVFPVPALPAASCHRLRAARPPPPDVTSPLMPLTRAPLYMEGAEDSP